MNKREKLILILISIFMIIFVIWGIKEAEASDNMQIKIEENNRKIEQIDEIKNQLHMTAELLRQEQYVSNNFDCMLSEKWAEYNNYQFTLKAENEKIYNDILEAEKTRNQKELIGNFKITHYCPCVKCNGNYGNKTALGTKLTPYKTIAVDPRIIPLGTKVEIQGRIYVAEDTGGAIKGNRIDMCVSSHAEAYKKGVLKNVPVYRLNN